MAIRAVIFDTGGVILLEAGEGLDRTCSLTTR